MTKKTTRSPAAAAAAAKKMFIKARRYSSQVSDPMITAPIIRNMEMDDGMGDDATLADFGGYDSRTCEDIGTFCTTIGHEATLGMAECCTALSRCVADVLLRICTPCINRHIDRAMDESMNGTTTTGSSSSSSSPSDENENENENGMENHCGRWILWLNPYSYSSISLSSMANNNDGHGDLRFRHDRTSSHVPFPGVGGGGELDPWERGPPYDLVYSSDEDYQGRTTRGSTAGSAAAASSSGSIGKQNGNRNDEESLLEL